MGKSGGSWGEKVGKYFMEGIMVLGQIEGDGDRFREDLGE